MANNTSGGNRINVPQAKGALDNMKYEIARELGAVSYTHLRAHETHE